MQQVNKKRVDDGEPKAGKVLDKIEKEKHIKDLANEVKHFDLKGIQRTVQNDLVLPAKDTDSSNSKNELVPFEDVEDFHGTKTSQSRLLKLKSSGSFRGSNLSNNSNSHNNNNSNNNKNNNNNTSESLNQNYGFNLSPLTSPFRRSLANNSQQEILSAKRTAQVHLIGRKLNLKEGKGNATVIMPEVLEDSNKYEYKLKQFCRERGMIAPSYSVSVREAGNQSKYYDCKLSVGDGFNISTYSAETHNEIAARELASKKAYNKLSMNDNLSSTLYDTEFVIRLKETCSEKNLPEPIFKTMECHPKNQPKYFISKVRIGDDILLSSYPVEAVDELSARDLAAKKAYDYLSLRNKSPAPISKGDKSILVQIFDMLKSKEYGVWCNKLQNLYWETYNEELPENWFELVQKSSKFEITNIEKVGYIIRSKNCSEGIEDFSETPELASLKVPESNHWEVYITNVVSSAEVWCRLIGKEYSVSSSFAFFVKNRFFFLKSIRITKNNKKKSCWPFLLVLKLFMQWHTNPKSSLRQSNFEGSKPLQMKLFNCSFQTSSKSLANKIYMSTNKL